jgi:DNA polymerase-3 subunit delta
VPSLNLQALKQRINDRKPGPVHLFVGEDTKLVDRMVDGIESVIDPADRPFAVDRLYAGEEHVTPATIADAARVFPMLGDRRLVIVLRAERLLKPKRAGRADEEAEEAEADAAPVDAGALEAYLAAPVPTTTLLFVATEVDGSRRLTKRLVEVALVTEFGGLKPESGFRRTPATADWLREELTRAGRTIDPDAARLLVDRSGNDVTKIRGDVERLLLFAGDRARLTLDDVMEVVSMSTAVDDVWSVTNALSEGNAARALIAAGQRFDHGDSPHAVVGQLRWWVSNKLAAAEPGRVRAAMDALLRTDLALKSSGGDDRILVERLLVELAGRPLPSQGWR